MHKTFDEINIVFKTMSKNERQCQPRRFGKNTHKTAQLLGIKNIIFEIKALNELIIIKGMQIKN